MSNIAYIRVSTEDQNTSRQEELFRDYKIDRFYKETVSGKTSKTDTNFLFITDTMPGKNGQRMKLFTPTKENQLLLKKTTRLL